jgi:hypothetical protein
MTTQAKLAAIEADLISASAKGLRHLHAEVFRKFAAMDMDAADLEAVMNGIMDEQEKCAANPLSSLGVGPALALGALIGAPLAAGAGFLLSLAKRDQAFNALKGRCPDLLQADPARFHAMFDLLWQHAPTVAGNPVVAGDVIRQLMALPMVDLGTVAKITGMYKSAPTAPSVLSMAHEQGIKSIVGESGKAVYHKISGLQVPVNHIAADGTRCFFDWGTDACKEAGITDAFLGGGTNLEQANQAYQMGQAQSGAGFLPLDSVVKELVMKEQELAQREQMIAQREAELGQMQQMMQQMGSAYQQQTGVDPDTGEALPEETEQGAAPEGEQAAESEVDAQQAMPTATAQNLPPLAEGEDSPTIDDAVAGSPYSGGSQLPGNEDGEHNEAALAQGLQIGPNTAESVNGTPEDQMHDAINNVEGEGTDKDNIADAELAAVMNAGGHTPDEAAMRAGAGPAAGTAEAVDPSALPAQGADASGSHEVTLPLRVSFKLGSAKAGVNPTLAAQAALAKLFS